MEQERLMRVERGKSVARRLVSEWVGFQRAGQVPRALESAISWVVGGGLCSGRFRVWEVSAACVDAAARHWLMERL
jgi:hypothetical protein